MGSVTSKTADSTAAQKVFGTFELLEHILLDGTMQDVYIQQRVSKTWYSTIANSKPLQRKMFRLCSNMPLRPLTDSRYPDRPFYGRSDSLIFNSAIDVARTIAKTDHRANAESRRTPVYFFISISSQPLQILVRMYSNEIFGWCRRAFTSPTGTWQSMLLTQPPVTALQVTVHGQPVMTLCNATGITLGDIWRCEQEVSAQEWPMDDEVSMRAHKRTYQDKVQVRFSLVGVPGELEM